MAKPGSWNGLFAKIENVTHVGNVSYTEDNILIYTIYFR